MSEVANTVLSAVSSTASGISKMSHSSTTPSDVGKIAARGEVEARRTTRKDWKEVCAELEKKNESLTNLLSEKKILSRRKRDAIVTIQRKGVVGKLPFTSRKMTVQDRLDELDTQIESLQGAIANLTQDKADLKSKIDELDTTIAATGQQALQQGINPEYSNMQDFDGILNET